MVLVNGKAINLMKSTIHLIESDASFRKFYRIKLNKKSKILVTAEKEKYKNLVAYLSVNEFLRKNKILTPKLYDYDLSKNMIIIEDFGSLSFYNVLSSKKNKLEVYRKIVDLLLKIQKIKPKDKIKNVHGKLHKIDKYSNKYLFEESDLFFDWYLPFFLTKKKANKIKNKSNKILLNLYNKLNFPNSYFVHRDFHVQNLMQINSKIGVIDSQDAMIGNPSYDLVSLIDDVRIKTSNKLKNQIFKYYINFFCQAHKFEEKKFLEDFNILSVQRSLKIIGIFSRLFKRDKKNKYLKFLPYTWKLLEMRMRSNMFLELRKVLDRNISKKTRKKIFFK